MLRFVRFKGVWVKAVKVQTAAGSVALPSSS